MSREFTCKKISKGKVEGEVISSSDAVCFYAVESKIGKIIESSHHLKDKSIAGRIPVMSSGKGGSVVQADGLYKLQLHGRAPKAIIVQHADTVLVSSAIIIRTPMVYKVEEGFCQEIKDGIKICMDAGSGKITIF